MENQSSHQKGIPVGNLHLSDSERNRILKEFNNTEWTIPDLHPLQVSFGEQARKHPDHIAIRYKNRAVTYRELDAKSNQLAQELMVRGVRPDSFIPIWIDRSPEWVIAILAVLKTGAVYIPIDPEYPVKRIAHIFEETNAPLLITSMEFSRPLSQLKEIKTCIIDDSSIYESNPDSLPTVSFTMQQLAYTIYTSGSTGTPKGVMIRQFSIAHLVRWHNEYFNVGPTSVTSLVAGLSFDISVWETWSALTAGATLVIADTEDRFSPESIYNYLYKNKITHGYIPTIFVPDVVQLTRDREKTSLKYLYAGGEQMKPVLTDGLYYDLIDYYGPTECTVFATFRKVKNHEGKFISSIGKPIANTRAYILDGDKKPVPTGAIGDLYISGAALSAGYLNKPSLTSEKFTSCPFEEDALMYATGDLAKWLPKGEIQFLGRKDKQVKIKGFRIELGDVETAIKKINQVKDAVVIAADHKSNKYLSAFLIPDNRNSQLNISEIRQQLRQELPNYMIPAQLLQIEEIPLTLNGKTDTAKLAEIATLQVENTTVLDAPEGFYEQEIAAMWADVLERPVINRSDSFFDIGGDSLSVAIITTEVSRRLNVKTYIRDLYQYPVLSEYTTLVKHRIENEGSNLPEEDMEPYVELERDVYLAPDTVFEGEFDPGILENPRSILLTGVTGFVGIHLLEELLNTTEADIYCLVRAQDTYHAMEKIRECYQKYNVPLRQEQEQRIKLIIGDLTHHNLGLEQDTFDYLAETIDLIYHSGSSVNFIEPYSYMKAANVEGLREIIRLAGAKKLKCLALLSTISVYSWGHIFTKKTVMLESDSIYQNLLSISKDIGYVRSKWVMEAVADLAASKGLPLITYRLGYAMCHSKTGACAEYQWWSGLVRNCIEFGNYPQLENLREGLISVDYMTQAMAHITKNKEAIGLKFNLIASPETNMTLEDFFLRIKEHYPFKLEPVSYKSWRGQWEDNNKNRLFSLTSLFKDNMHEGLSTVELYQNTYIWDCSNVQKFLQDSDVKEPVFNKEVLDAYLDYLKIEVPVH